MFGEKGRFSVEEHDGLQSLEDEVHCGSRTPRNTDDN